MQFEEIKPGSFIYRLGSALPGKFCAEIVNRFEQSQDEQYSGRIGQNAESDTTIKKTTDIRVSGRDNWRDVDARLFESLGQALGLISKLHPFFAVNQFKDTGYNLQRYQAGEYYQWHVDGGPGVFSQRQLVAIWYLNDVPGPGGETEFAFQELKVKPVAGDMLLFPPYWTHVHRAVEVLQGVKYIATTWVSYAE